MNWLTQNWLWILLGLGVVLVFARRRHQGGRGIGGYRYDGTLPAPGDVEHGGHGGDYSTGNQSVPPTEPKLAIDPVTRRDVPTAQAVTSIYQGRIYYFETTESRQRFEASPEQYARAELGHSIAPPQGPFEQRRARRRGC